jgi:hypothetical integral membrane protein (TIGR02206 family)
VDLLAAALTFRPYGLTHWVIVVLTVVGAVLLARLGRRHRNTPAGETFTRIFAIVQLTVTLGFMIVWLVPPLFDLPVTAYALWSRRPWAFALTYYWGLTINPQAILTPDLQLDIAPALEFASYWSQHVLVMWAAVYLTWGLGLRPTWRSYRLALAVTVAWAAIVFAINRALGTNYGYLNGKPGGASLALLAASWALITWPWTFRRESIDLDGQRP